MCIYPKEKLCNNLFPTLVYRPVPAVKIRKANSDVALGSRDGNKRLVRFRPYLESDNGMYVCEATNQFGEKDSRTFYLEGDGMKFSYLLHYTLRLMLSNCRPIVRQAFILFIKGQ